MNKTNVQPVEFSVAEAQPAGKPLLKKDLSLIENLAVQLETRLGGASMSVKELYALRQGDIVSLNSSVQDDIDLLLNGEVIARGKLVAADGHFAIEVISLAEHVE
ncbi:FliM/FliN family flagellar motor switch protein [Rheinheimera aquimaris]|jgi:flagellar motor switch protein FliN/FliY|uniref:FliM/FliN family flagellar motor switch protein n=1 Tax=Rheinheimera aquimaris TaxID=412437 RepID=UPI001E5D950C|nr:FliM/FliN family flagellar motor switch protein [Rheinheimera aquimaris]MCD1600348.1 FliM/FliN family flagellar motor switch protein [Rheinheimera aquimaris]